MAQAIDPRRIEVIDEASVRALSRLTGVERLAMIDAMFRSARELTLASIRNRYPTWDEARVAAELRRRMSHGAYRPAA